MKQFSCKFFLFFWLLLPLLGSSQAYVTATYSSGDLPTDINFQHLPDTSSCAGMLSVSIPAGSEITGVDVEYTMTALGAAYITDQVSWLRCVTTGTGESSASFGSDWSAGTAAYSRTGLTIANGATGTVEFALHAGRTYGGTGCNTTFNKVNNSTWVLTVYYAPIPSCQAPNAITATNIATDSADLGWNSSATLFQTEYGISPLTLGTGIRTTTSDNPLTLQGLDPNTTYDFYVRAICGAGDTSAWSVVSTFTTDCGVLTIPYSENFDGVTAPGLANCILQQNVNGDSEFWQTSGDYPKSFPNAMYIGDNSFEAMDDWFFIPGLLLTGGVDYQLKFSYRSSASYEEKLEVKFGNSATAAGMTGGQLWVDSTIMSSTYITDSVVFTPSASGVYYAGFHGFSDMNMSFLCVDDVSIIEVASSLSDSAEILTFDIPLQVSSIVDSQSATVTVVMPQGTNLTSLIPAITVSDGAAINPMPGSATNFTTTVVYTVTAEDEVTQKSWNVNVSILDNLSENADGFRVFPNPAVNKINVDLGTFATGQYLLQVINLNGDVVKNDMFRYDGVTLSMEVRDLKPGTYILHIEGAESSAWNTFIKD